MTKCFALFAAWGLALSILIMTLGPVGLRPQLGHPHAERFVAYIVLGAAFSIAYPRQRAWVMLGVICAALGLEFGQLLAPGRDARLSDALVKAVGAATGVLAVLGFEAGRGRTAD